MDSTGATPAGMSRQEFWVTDEQADLVPSADDRVREFLAPVNGIEERPLVEHAQVYGAVHASLQDALTEIDGAAG